MEVTSNHEPASSMLESLTPAEETSPKPRVLRDAGKEVEAEPEKDDVSEAAAKLGKKGGEAAAASRAAKAKEQTKDDSSETATAATDDEDIAEAEKAEKEGKLGKPRHDARARMLEKAREAKALKAEVERERTERTRLAAEVARLSAPKPADTPAPAKVEAKPQDDARPKQDDFETYDAWVEALTEYNADRKIAKLQKEASDRFQAQQASHARNEGFRTFFGRMGEAAKADPAFTEKTVNFVGRLQTLSMLGEGQQPDAFTALSEEIFTSKQSPALAVYFSENPDEEKRICALPSRSAVIREVATIEARLSAATTATAPRVAVSQAKPPVRPVAGSPHTVDSEPDEHAPLSAHISSWGRRAQAAHRR